MTSIPGPDKAHHISTEMYHNAEATVRLGTFGGHEILYCFVPDGRYSTRATVYVHAVPDHTGGVAFTQMSTVKRELVTDRAEADIERLLIVDAVERMKRRIKSGAFRADDIYTSDLTEADVIAISRRAA